MNKSKKKIINRKSKKKSPKKKSPKKKSPIKKYNHTPLATDIFIKFCKLLIMINDLDSVVKTTWLQNNDCNIFLVGEIHKRHEQTNCKEILSLFKKLIKIQNIQIDLMVEFKNTDVSKGFYKTLENERRLDKKDFQMNEVRNLLIDCIQHKSCDNIHVHWTDPLVSPENKRYNKLPKWIKILNTYTYPTFDFSWINNKEITKYFNPKKNEDDILNLLLKNPIAMKEIKKAYKINPFFEINNIKSIFLEIYDITKTFYEKEDDDIIFSMSRTVMDFYTIARIIKSDMKNVIIYVGLNHSERIIYIFNKYLNFNIKQEVIGSCYNDEKVDIWKRPILK